jgi:hypothetical protein
VDGLVVASGAHVCIAPWFGDCAKWEGSFRRRISKESRQAATRLVGLVGRPGARAGPVASRGPCAVRRRGRAAPAGALGARPVAQPCELALLRRVEQVDAGEASSACSLPECAAALSDCVAKLVPIRQQIAVLFQPLVSAPLLHVKLLYALVEDAHMPASVAVVAAEPGRWAAG